MRANQIVSSIAAVILLSSVPATLQAGSATAEMRVSATVLARTLVDVDRSVQSVRVTEDDLQRGYVEIPAALAVRIKTNARNGYLLRFEALQGPFASGEVTWGNNVVQLGRDERWITQPVEQQGAAVMNVRLSLADDARAGEYPLALGISGQPL